MGGLRRVGLIAFSTGFWVVSFAWMGICAALTATLRLVGVPYWRFHSHVPAPMFATCVRLSGNRLRITYDPEHDRERRSVFCQNHVNLLDAHVATASIPHAFCGLMNAWQFHIPIYGWMMWLSHGIAVRRSSPGGTVAQLTIAAKRRKALNLSVLTFPEGHRTRDGKVHEFRTGVLAMARNAGMPVVPLAVRGNYAANRKGTYVFSPGHVFEVYVGPQLETEGLDDRQLRALAGTLRAAISEWVEQGTWPEKLRERAAASVADAASG